MVKVKVWQIEDGDGDGAWRTRSLIFEELPSEILPALKILNSF